MNITRTVLPVMRKQRSGTVVTITSTAGIVGQEFCSAYAASKFGVEGWMESLRFEVEPFGVHTTIVEPGFFRTELLRRTRPRMPICRSTTTPHALRRHGRRGRR